MKINRAIFAFLKKYPEKKPIGYWKVDEGFIINTEPMPGLIEPAQFLITDNGEVNGVNPIMFGLTSEKMKKIKF